MVHTVTFRGAMVIYNRIIYVKIHNKLLYELGDTPLGRWARSAPGPVIDEGRPELPRTNYTILHNNNTFTRGTISYKFTICCATIKQFHVLGETPPNPRSRAMSSSGVVKGAPSFTIQSATQTASIAQENYTLKTINWFYKMIFTSKYIPRGN